MAEGFHPLAYQIFKTLESPPRWAAPDLDNDPKTPLQQMRWSLWPDVPDGWAKRKPLTETILRSGPSPFLSNRLKLEEISLDVERTKWPGSYYHLDSPPPPMDARDLPRRGPGRPPKEDSTRRAPQLSRVTHSDTGEPRTEKLVIYVGREEKVRIHEAADRAGLAMSSWVHRMILDGVAESETRRRDDDE